MRFRVKLIIFGAAVVVSVLGFYLISSPFVGLYTLTKDTGHESIDHSLSECDGDAGQIPQITDKPLQMTYLSPSYCDPVLKRNIGISK